MAPDPPAAAGQPWCEGYERAAAPGCLGRRVGVGPPRDQPGECRPGQGARRREGRQRGQAQPLPALQRAGPGQHPPPPRPGQAGAGDLPRPPGAEGQGQRDPDRAGEGGERDAHGGEEAVTPSASPGSSGQSQRPRGEQQAQGLGVGNLQHEGARRAPQQGDRPQRRPPAHRRRQPPVHDDGGARGGDRRHQRRTGVEGPAGPLQRSGERGQQRHEGPGVLGHVSARVPRELGGVAPLADAVVPARVPEGHVLLPGRAGRRPRGRRGVGGAQAQDDEGQGRGGGPHHQGPRPLTGSGPAGGPATGPPRGGGALEEGQRAEHSAQRTASSRGVADLPVA